ncbi:hypothetical protein AGMMS4956_10850 [Bacteroidia bacterium]|nr:hypothetical protein AGMMS4956_10850 [Bacteroidia bacterium]
MTMQPTLEPYAEVMRYLCNAEEVLQKAGKEDKFYLDSKYVRMACGTAYSGVLLALDAWLKTKGVEMPKRQRKSIDFYLANIAKLDRKMLDYVNTVYDILHLSGYYDGVRDVRVIRAGFEHAYTIVEKIKPNVPEAELQTYIAEYQKKKASLWKKLFK